MSSGVSFGSVGGVRVVVGVSWLIILPIVALGMFATIDPGSDSLLVRVLVGAGASLLLWVSILVHELGHAMAARRHGIAVERVVVFLLGGYSEMDLDAANPGQEWTVAVTGPIFSGVLSVGLIAGASVAPANGAIEGTLALLALVNGGVAAFNLLPAFPLDGGRMLRSSLVRRGWSPGRAERVAIGTGLVLGGLMALGGIGMSIAGSGVSVLLVPAGLLVTAMAASALPRRAAEEI